jgi:hypothetical protein
MSPTSMPTVGRCSSKNSGYLCSRLGRFCPGNRGRDRGQKRATGNTSAIGVLTRLNVSVEIAHYQKWCIEIICLSETVQTSR